MVILQFCYTLFYFQLEYKKRNVPLHYLIHELLDQLVQKRWLNLFFFAFIAIKKQCGGLYFLSFWLHQYSLVTSKEYLLLLIHRYKHLRSLLGRGSCFRLAKSFLADSRKLFAVVIRPSSINLYISRSRVGTGHFVRGQGSF